MSIPGMQQSFRPHEGVKMRTGHEFGENALQYRPQVNTYGFLVTRAFQELLNGPEVEEGCIHGVIGVLGGVCGKAIGDEAIPFMERNGL